MLSLSRDANKCIFCAFRSQQLALKSRRLRIRTLHHPSYLRKKEKTSQRLSIRYTNDPRRASERPAPTRLGDNGVIRKFVRGDEGERRLRFQPPDFESTVAKRLDVLKEELKNAPLLEQLKKEAADDDGQLARFSRIWRSFVAKIIAPDKPRVPFFGEAEGSQDKRSLTKDLRDAFKMRGQSGLDERIKYAFYAHVTGSRFTANDIKNQQTLADLRYPSEWFPATRAIHRTVHLHVGPTNSGKTYHALKRLEAAETGVYAGPLRLLAHEVYSRMNAKGKSCSLITGEERRMANPEAHEYGAMSACTVEMMPLNKSLDVAVIDEIQMIGNAERGWAWTQALLGVKAKEVHLCGEERTVPLIKELCASVGEKLEIHRYERLSPLQVANESLDGRLKNLRKGDCIVSFSVIGIHALRRQIERVTGRKVATVYGSLPPETRAAQARLFNDPNNDYDYLVASDAVGMGLNLAIKRIVFETSNKFDGYQRRTLGIADIKQIAGRAGRYRIANQDQNTADQDLSTAKGDSPPQISPPPPTEENIGLVTTLEKFDFPIVRAAMSADPEPIHTAGLFPPAPVLERFASYFPPGTPFSYILTRLHELSQMHSRFHLCGLKDQVWIADLIEPVQGLTISDRNIICSCPASKGDRELWAKLMPAYARCIAEQTGGSIIDIKELPLEVLEAELSASREYLRELETLHKGIVAYLWLSYRFAGIFNTRTLAFHVKSLVEEKIEKVLDQFSFSETQRRKIAERREKALLRGIGEDLDVDDDVDEQEEDIEADEVDAEPADVSVEENARLDEQTTLTSGGDNFAGEEDEYGLMDSALAGEEGQQSSPGSFAEWRRDQTRNDHEESSVPELDDLLSDAVAAGQRKASNQASDHEITVADVLRPEEASAELSDSMSEALSPESNPSDLDAPVTPETDLESPPLETQEVHPPPSTEQDSQPRLGSVPPKHLHLHDVGRNATELERDAATRP